MTPTPSPLPAVWSDLPDPRDERCPDGGRDRVQLDEAGFRHVVERHVGQLHEPWHDLLPAEVLAALRAWNASGRYGMAPAAAAASFAARLGEEVSHSLQRPLVVLYESYRFGRGIGRYPVAWELVLPCGALLVVRSGPRRPNRVTTCLFRRTVCGLSPPVRWRRLANFLVCRYAKWDSNRLRLPARDHPVQLPREAPCEVRVRIRFVRPETWGFDTQHPEGYWLGLKAPWPAAPAPRPARRRLDPRWRTRPENGDG